jgi:hypothetical protein
MTNGLSIWFCEPPDVESLNVYLKLYKYIAQYCMVEVKNQGNTRSSQDQSVNFNLKPPPVACSGSQEVPHLQ